jgi:hypothetical protein
MLLLRVYAIHELNPRSMTGLVVDMVGVRCGEDDDGMD